MKSPFQVFYRIILGLIFFLLGINEFANVIPFDVPGDQAQLFMEGIIAIEYFKPLLGSTYILGGFLLIINKAVPFALILTAPVVLNIFLFHLFLNPSGLLGPFGLACILSVILIYKYRSHYKLLFSS